MEHYRKYFINALKENFPDKWREMTDRVDEHFKIISPDVSFAATSKNPIDKRLDFSAFFLSLIKTLDERGETFDRIRRICLQIVTEYVRPKNRFQHWLKRLPVRLIDTPIAGMLIRAFHKRVSKNAHPDGFVANILTDKQETLGLGYGFDILECGICKLFKKHNYQKYVSILCEVDAITANLAGLRLVRTGTIALGAKKCDFRFEKEPNKMLPVVIACVHLVTLMNSI